MPYYVYAVKAFGQLEKQAEFDAFKDASAHAKALRVDAPSGARIKVMFADDALAAEALLLQVRAAGPTGDD